MGSGNTERTVDDGQQKWRRAVFAINLVCMAMILVTELIMFFVFECQGLRTQPLGEYLYRYLFLPTALDGIILAAGIFFMRICGRKPEILNYIPLVQMVFICFMLSTIHYMFTAMFCTFCFPIFVSVIFNDRKLTRFVTILDFVLLTAAQFLGPWFTEIVDSYQFANYLVTVAILLCANILCDLLLQYQKQKNRKIEVMYRNRMEMLEQMKYDQKTGLHGHTSFQTGLKKLVDEAELRKRPAVAVLDIDDFKKVNDTYGHNAGDLVLFEVAARIMEKEAPRICACRWGGEEFLILSTGEGAYQRLVGIINELVQKIRNDDHVYENQVIKITISAGISVWEKGEKIEHTISRADQYLYEAKKAGKNRYIAKDKIW